MFRRIWFWLREVVWTAVVAVTLVICAVALSVLGSSDIALAVGLGAVTFGLLSIRS
jgi:ABC-type transport system involved in cytochrome c biogenesis permease component